MYITITYNFKIYLKIILLSLKQRITDLNDFCLMDNMVSLFCLMERRNQDGAENWEIIYYRTNESVKSLFSKIANYHLNISLPRTNRKLQHSKSSDLYIYFQVLKTSKYESFLKFQVTEKVGILQSSSITVIPERRATVGAEREYNVKFSGNFSSSR